MIRYLVGFYLLLLFVSGCSDGIKENKSYIIKSSKSIDINSFITIKSITINDHEYYILTGPSMGGICHSASCNYCNNLIRK